METDETSPIGDAPVRRAAALQQRGQTTVALAAVLALAILLGGVLATLAGAMVQRQRAQAAADAVALATTADDQSVEDLVAWYHDRDVEVDFDDGYALATSGRAQAEAWATIGDDVAVGAMPALVAIVARAEQLLGEPFLSVRVVGDRVELHPADAPNLRLVAGELGLCERAVPGSSTHTIFGLC